MNDYATFTAIISYRKIQLVTKSEITKEQSHIKLILRFFNFKQIHMFHCFFLNFNIYVFFESSTVIKYFFLLFL